MRYNFPLFSKLIAKPHQSQTGLTLLEVMVTLVMTSLILVAIGPPLIISAATRVKMRRASQARLIAQEELNRVQTIMMRSRDENLPKEGSTVSLSTTYIGLPSVSNISSTADLSETPAPKSMANLKEVDVDQDGDSDFMVQLFREQGALFAGGQAKCEPAVFQMGVRVYSILAKDNLDSLETEKVSLLMTRGLGQQKTNPLEVLYAEVSRSDRDLSLKAYQDYLENNGIPAGCT